ncbi:predicted protein [Lichtheimia corymbifera JMRC:FSU:9682]|uniref:Uncharacterized protein n=1 Tax=Lichtheimia corymbifera JMRC:FSU:9682 TaxID=1263082 RepID=A0A068RZX2_9FUNG|nr:predicted protein [Lichtheimia corymbifera JMRC:FSU:9682]
MVSTASPNQSSSSQIKEHHHATDNTQKDNDIAQNMKPPTNRRVSTLVILDDATDDEDVDKRPITLNEAALKEISSNIADDVELVSKPTNSKRNKLSLGKKRRRATND